MSYLSSVYMETYEEEKALPLFEKAFNLRKDEMTDEERKVAIEYIESLKRKLQGRQSNE